ncbi:acyltransferase [Hahella sp. CCB-MM4]|uniref:acyltransferase family protein n=1 Tax=Hahella sp. (strain CCB-MM4) TaxID=1926491 RepID=UPI000BCE67EB|nr:acyltransferase family protein [Hahella sp. CCB-MM4]OZG72097.1 acyltransferase [Hahella sp. CCB-MM4]
MLRPDYRPDIDGLRALAVISVVLFHAFPGKIKGGFVGVDIFFVISGYLISSIIFSNLDRGTFSFLEFYARRIKRIFPALLIVLLSCLVFGWFALLADEYEQIGKHVVAGTGFVSNLILWGESGYFDGAAEMKPLLHLWSLGVEEQYYIFWPLLLWLSSFKRSGFLLCTTGVLAVSFLLNIFIIRYDAVAAFYWPVTRFWELSVGGLLAYMTLHKFITPSVMTVSMANGFSLVGSLLLGVSILMTNKDYSFPGWWAVLPVVGTALVIMAGMKASINRKILASKIFVWFGLISFPLYLWHWPILSFGAIAEGQTPDRQFKIYAIIASIVLAWATYKFVELNVRHSSGKRYVNFLVIVSLCAALSGGYVYSKGGLADRSVVVESEFSEEVRHQFMGPLWEYTMNDICLNEFPFQDVSQMRWWFCMKSDKREPTLIILGNSYANQLYPGFVNNSLLTHHTIVSIGTCDFAGDNRRYVGVDSKHPCYLDRAAKQRKFIDKLIENEPSIQFAVIDGLSREPDQAYIEALRTRVSYLENMGIRVIIFTPHIKPGFNPKACFTTPIRRVARDCSFAAKDRKDLYKSFLPLIESIAKTNPDVLFFEQNGLFCSGERCTYTLNGMPLHRDEGHLSEFGSIQLQSYFTDWAKKNVPTIFDRSVIGR